MPRTARRLVSGTNSPPSHSFIAMMRLERLSVDKGPRLRAIRLRALLDAPDAFGSTYEEIVARPAESWSKQLADLPTFVAVRDGIDVGMVRCARDEASV